MFTLIKKIRYDYYILLYLQQNIQHFFPNLTFIYREINCIFVFSHKNIY